MARKKPDGDAVTVSVRTAAEFYYEGGDLTAGAGLTRMLEGAQAHRAVQAAYREGWVSEAPLQREINIDGIAILLVGRADGLGRDEAGAAIEEIKSLIGDASGMTGDEYPAHWAQAEMYGAMLAWRDGLDEVTIRLRYVSLTGGEAVFSRILDRSTLEGRLQMYLRPMAAWLRTLSLRQARCRDTMRACQFPYERFRDGQRAMSANVYVALRDRKNLLCQAPTGTGKTIAALFPAIKAIGEGCIERVFFLTARNTGRKAVMDALKTMRDKGLDARAVILTAKDAICPMPERDCRPEVCPRAKGYYDRRREALREALDRGVMDRADVEALAERYTLCPFELSLDISEQCDVIICDYNYAFDPRVRLQRFFVTGRADSGLLVDEAHNLCARACDMLSSSLSRQAFAQLRREVGKALRRGHALYRALTAIIRALDELRPDDESDKCLMEQPNNVIEALKAFIDISREALDLPLSFHGLLFDRYCEAVDFLRAAEAFDHKWRVLVEPQRPPQMLLTLFCADPSPHIAGTLKRVHGAALFSATVTPMPFYRDILGLREETDALLDLPSPFPPERQLTLTMNMPLRYKQRISSIDRLVEALKVFTEAKTGNYLICFPSYAFMRQTVERVDWPCRTLIQTPDMDDEQRQAFLDTLTPEPGETTVAFVVMGGVFAEGIDLVGSRLIGAAIVGTGVPQLSARGDALRALYDQDGRDGYDYAYLYPGLTRVLQAAGRVIRSENDKGAVLLIDSRWCEQKHAALLPPHWRCVNVRDLSALARRLQEFWGEE